MQMKEEEKHFFLTCFFKASTDFHRFFFPFAFFFANDAVAPFSAEKKQLFEGDWSGRGNKMATKKFHQFLRRRNWLEWWMEFQSFPWLCFVKPSSAALTPLSRIFFLGANLGLFWTRQEEEEEEWLDALGWEWPSCKLLVLPPSFFLFFYQRTQFPV